MAATIKIKNSSTAGAVPTSSDLVQGELAVNVTDKRIFTENASGTVVELGTNPSSITTASATITGNTTLGDASTDTVTVNGYMGVGGAGVSQTAINITSSALTGSSTCRGVNVAPTFQSGATSSGSGVWAAPSTAAASFTMTNMYSFIAVNGTKGAGSTITNQYGFACDDLSRGDNIYGFSSSVSSGSNKWNIYASGTADNYFAGNVGIGSTNPSQKLVVVGANSDTEIIRMVTGSSSGVQQTTGLGFAFSTAVTYPSALISALEYDVADQRGSITFATNGTNTDVEPTERMRIDSSGNVLVTSSGGLGYGTGSGGTVTQATSRTTGVTLNKTNGAITLVSAAGSTTIASFTVTNSTVAATDTIIVNQKSGTDLYRIYVTNVAAGSFKVSFATLSGTTTEQPVFNFAVIKSVTS